MRIYTNPHNNWYIVIGNNHASINFVPPKKDAIKDIKQTIRTINHRTVDTYMRDTRLEQIFAQLHYPIDPTDEQNDLKPTM